MRFWWAAILAIVFGIPSSGGLLAQQGELVGTTLSVAYLATAGGAAIRLLEGPATLTPGAQVRATVETAASAGGRSERVQGTLVRVDADSLTIRLAEGDLRLARADVPRVQLYRGIESKWAQGFAMGFAIGAVVGAAGGFLSGDDPQDEFFAFTAPEKAAILAAVGAVTGSTLGAAIGLFTHGDHWQRARLQATPIVAPAPGRAMRIGGAVRF